MTQTWGGVDEDSEMTEHQHCEKLLFIYYLALRHDFQRIPQRKNGTTHKAPAPSTRHPRRFLWLLPVATLMHLSIFLSSAPVKSRQPLPFAFPCVLENRSASACIFAITSISQRDYWLDESGCEVNGPPRVAIGIDYTLHEYNGHS